MINRIPVAKPVIGDEEINAVAEVLKSGYYTSGPRVKAFEEAYAEYVGTDHARGVSSGTSAIYLTLQGLGISPGDEVIVPAMTFFSTATSVLRVGATPIFADINLSTYNLSSHDVLKKITDKTKAIIPVHFYGLPADMDEFNKIGTDHDIYIIEDAAQAHGAVYKGKKVGSLGDAGCWSFFATKNMTCACEAGMVTTNNEDLASKISVLRSHGMCDRNTHAMLGYNDRMDEVAGAVGLVQLRKLDTFNELRIDNSMYLRRKLRDVPWLQPPPLFRDRTHVFFWANFKVNEEVLGMSVDELRTSLWDRGMGTRHRYNAPLYKQPALNQFLHLHRYDKDYCPNAENMAGKMIGLPNYPGLTQNELERVVDIIKET